MGKYRIDPRNIVAGLADDAECFATDRITVDGRPVGYMYRDDSGWNFFAGDEDQAYVDNPDNIGLFTLNDIANYDHTVRPYLHAPPGTAWLREGNQFVKDSQGAPTEPAQPATGLQPEFPVAQGVFKITDDWSIDLPQPMNRRFEDDALVLWRPGLTAWITVWGNPKLDSPTIRLSKIKQMSSPRRYDEKEWTNGGLIYYTYRLNENPDQSKPAALYGDVIGIAGHIQIAAFFDHEASLAPATVLVGRISSHGPSRRSALTSDN
ncbi:hypothetical protein A5634_03510 [Mycobacterium asiaticum]|uniref:Immunity protein Imm33 domain-containing protein n=1 Tax=Mycobacterium asiaticum TaxID=1790 RepID=A0A1A3NSP8_MYCAS|nr:DUF2185 domain-containing protein [Mycobacterium asiaticum]OBK24405.1 hypothetical protein A5634_03510 [Mycobacterium asiaticum]